MGLLVSAEIIQQHLVKSGWNSTSFLSVKLRMFSVLYFISITYASGLHFFNLPYCNYQCKFLNFCYNSEPILKGSDITEKVDEKATTFQERDQSF